MQARGAVLVICLAQEHNAIDPLHAQGCALTKSFGNPLGTLAYSSQA